MHLNYFEPFESKTPNHEDQLTRAFMVVLRMVPMAHAMFLDLVRAEQERTQAKNRVPPLSVLANADIRFSTQVGSIAQRTGTLLSIVITDDQWQASADIRPSNRVARYDGLIIYEPDWIMVIENKPWSSNIWEGQLSPNVGSDFRGTVEPRAVVISWRTVIESLNVLIDRNLTQGAEESLVRDFLDFIDSNFAFLNPFTVLSVCKNDPRLVAKRCRAILEQIAPGQVEYHRGWGKDSIRIEPAEVIKEIALYPLPDDEDAQQWDDIALAIFPGVTVSQAQQLYQRVNISKLQTLGSSWELSSYLHFAFMSTNLVWANPAPSISDYLAFWQTHVEWIRQWKRPEFRLLFDELRRNNLITPENVSELENLFTATARGHINVCPGIALLFKWTNAQATELDKSRKLVSEVREKIGDAFSTWGSELPESFSK